MKNSLLIFGAFVLLGTWLPKQAEAQVAARDTADLTNNFYDNETVMPLPMVTLSVDGEIANPGVVDFSKLPIHSVIVKETKLNPDGSNTFEGAYRYDGYSLFDILNKVKLQKKNGKDFAPIIDLYIEVSNDKGEKVILSWGELYYPNNLQNIIIANAVMRIVPSKTMELWPLPETSKLVVPLDLLTARNISNPSKITIRSIDATFKVQKGLSPMFSESFKLTAENGKEVVIKEISKELSKITYHSIFYGRGRGIHSTTPFTGYVLKEVMEPYYTLAKENIQHGLFVFAGFDGYRVAMTYAELFNRNDQAEFLLLNDQSDKDGGCFKIFPACDFFSDRAVKSLKEVRFERR
ncbi:hypothetical protein [Williamwhitmania taraxaci]|uniref:Uncharacterized protein n=1 Tax=Williamwhitmania taraxaci TaxID=1640674 RepID=A0A1G6HF75_9BACT|nr:hypothetical protein [Williamwhitmania taraxaci]SDB92803.1 hypothetical protein SAMN05216323_101017 [Williamwhitmania taraxaci]